MRFPGSPDPLEQIVFISIPEDLEQPVEGFTIDPGILLPVELTGPKDSLELNQLSWEQITAGLCKVIAYEPEHENVDYYRSFLLILQPDIETELSKGGVRKADEKEFALAEEIFLILRNLFPENIGHALNLALAMENHSSLYSELGKDGLSDSYRELTFQEYLRILKEAPENPEAQFNAGHFFFKQGNYPKALACFREYMSRGSDKKRKKLLTEIIEKLEQQNRDDNLFKEAYDYITMGNESQGLEKIDRFLQDHPDVWNAWFIKGWAHRRRGEFDRGKDAFHHALELTEPSVDLLNELSICTMELEEYSQSRKFLEQALRLEPENVKIISNLGILTMKTHQYGEAAGFFRTALDISPDDEIAKQYLNFIEESLKA